MIKRRCLMKPVKLSFRHGSCRLLLPIFLLLIALTGVTCVKADDHLRKRIDGVKVTISRPVAGTTTEVLPKIECPFNSHYGVYTTDGEPWVYWKKDLGPSFTFGETHRLFVTLSADTEYYFPEDKAPVISGGTLVEYEVSNYPDEPNDPGFSLMEITVDMPVTSHDLNYAVITGLKDKVYTGSPLKQNLVITMAGETLRSGLDYSVTLKNNKNVGTATVIIKGAGAYKTSSPRYLYFEIRPKPTVINSRTATKGGFIVKWKKQTAGTTGYQIQYSTNKDFKGTTTKSISITKNTIVKKTLSNLKSKKKYYVRIRTYTKADGSKYYSAWSAAKTVTTK